MRCRRRNFLVPNLLVTDTAQKFWSRFLLREKPEKSSHGQWNGRRVHSSARRQWAATSRPLGARGTAYVSLGDHQAGPIAGAIKRASDLTHHRRDNRRRQAHALDRWFPNLKARARFPDLIIEAVPECPISSARSRGMSRI